MCLFAHKNVKRLKIATVMLAMMCIVWTAGKLLQEVYWKQWAWEVGLPVLDVHHGEGSLEDVLQFYPFLWYYYTMYCTPPIILWIILVLQNVKHLCSHVFLCVHLVYLSVMASYQSPQPYWYIIHDDALCIVFEVMKHWLLYLIWWQTYASRWTETQLLW